MKHRKRGIDWGALIKDWETSGLSQKLFCEQRSISYCQFKNKRYLINKTSGYGDTSTFIEQSAPSKVPLVPITMRPDSASRATLSLRLPGGGILDIPSSMSSTDMKALLQGLGLI